MAAVSRRGFLAGVSAGLGAGLVGRPASATVVRAVPLSVLVQSSRRVLVVTPLAAESHFEELGRRRRIVTDTRVRVEEQIESQEVADSELLVRTLGGAVGRQGELVHGQARLELGQSCVLFLLQAPDGLHYVNAMSQGHYPLRVSAARELMRSPDLPEILDFERSAVKELAGTELRAARQRIRALVKP